MRRTPFVIVLTIMLLIASIRSSLAQTSKSASSEQPPPMALKVGDIAPYFTLRDQAGKDVSLKDFQGKKTVVLAFYIFAFSGG